VRTDLIRELLTFHWTPTNLKVMAGETNRELLARLILRLNKCLYDL